MTTKQKISQAFATLREKSYFVRHRFWCCQTCGWAGVPEDKADRAVFYHAQDAENLEENGECHLAWAGDGRQIVNHLEAAGLEVEWDGRKESRMLVRERAEADVQPNACSRDMLRALIDAYDFDGVKDLIAEMAPEYRTYSFSSPDKAEAS